MLVRRLDPGHDMTFGQGLANYARDDEATAQAVKTRLLLLFNEWFLDTGAGQANHPPYRGGRRSALLRHDLRP